MSVTGCGASNGNQHADSSVAAEESSPAETTQKADNSQTDAPADQEEEKEPSHDLTGADAEGYIHDASYETRANAAAGSLEQPYGRYRLKDADGVFYYFDGEGTCYYVQKGTYSFSHDASTDGTDEDMISMQFDVQENPTNYIIDEEDGQLMDPDHLFRKRGRDAGGNESDGWNRWDCCNGTVRGDLYSVWF